MFGINKNGTKHKIGIIMPASYPASRITRESVSVTADGVKTYSTLLNELYALIDNTKITTQSVIKIVSTYGVGFFNVVFIASNAIYASYTTIVASGSNKLNVDGLVVSSNSNFYQYRDGTSSDVSSVKLNNGGKITLYY